MYNLVLLGVLFGRGCEGSVYGHVIKDMLNLLCGRFSTRKNVHLENSFVLYPSVGQNRILRSGKRPLSLIDKFGGSVKSLVVSFNLRGNLHLLRTLYWSRAAKQGNLVSKS